jgi:hypothetical protein
MKDLLSGQTDFANPPGFKFTANAATKALAEYLTGNGCPVCKNVG